MKWVRKRITAAFLFAAIVITSGAAVRPGSPMLCWLAPNTAWAIATEEELLDQERQAEAERERREAVENERQASEKWAAERLDRRIAATQPQMAYVEGGSFQMGDLFSGEWSNARPIHSVSVRSFSIGRYELTFAEYDAFCEDTGRKMPGDRGLARERRPVINVSWFDAVEYCNWRSRQDGFRPCYTINGDSVSCDFLAGGYRLPTEAEWEYAARGGKNSQGYRYSGGDNADAVAWYGGNADKITHEVGLKQPNELGVFDMSGNVSEWCWDWEDREYYKYGISGNPVGPASGSSRVRRGGDNYRNEEYARVGYRMSGFPEDRALDVGFRLARTQ